MEFLIELLWAVVVGVVFGYSLKLARAAGLILAIELPNTARLCFVIFALLTMASFFTLLYCALFSHQYLIDPLVMGLLTLVMFDFTNSLRINVEHDY